MRRKAHAGTAIVATIEAQMIRIRPAVLFLNPIQLQKKS